MADIKVDLSTGHKIANPFRTTRKSTTNPFKYQNFEGNTLQFADVFEGFKPSFKGAPGQNKIKLIASSVAGCMTKIRSSIAEPITQFVNRVWEYAKTTNVTKFGSYKPITDLLNMDIADIGKGIKHSISSGIELLNTDITGLGKGISNRWNELISKIHTSGIPKNATVAEYRALWENEIELAKKAQVA